MFEFKCNEKDTVHVIVRRAWGWEIYFKWISYAESIENIVCVAACENLVVRQAEWRGWILLEKKNVLTNCI